MARKEIQDIEPLDETFDPAAIEHDEVALVPAAQGGALTLGQMSGEEDVPLRLPYISIVYGVSEAIANFDVADLILDKTTLLSKKNQPVKFIVLNAATYWKEWFTREERELAKAENRHERVCQTREEVAAVGGTCPTPSGAWPNNQRPTFSQAMTLDLLIRKPESAMSGMFGVRVGEYDYAPARWCVDKTVFKAVGPVITAAKRLALKLRGLHSGVFEVVINVKQGTHGAQPVPTVRLVGNLSDEELKDLGAFFGV